MTDCFFCDGNGRPQKAPVGPVGKPVVQIWISFTFAAGNIGGVFSINAGPFAKLEVREFAVVGRPGVGINFPGFEGANNKCFINGNASGRKASVCPPGKAIGKQS